MFDGWSHCWERLGWWLLVGLCYGVLIACIALMQFADEWDEFWHEEE